jgi:hypothetical protein
MDDLDLIRKRLQKASSEKEEQTRLVELFDRACTGLETGMSGGVKADVRKRLDGLLDEVRNRAESVEEMIKE